MNASGSKSRKRAGRSVVTARSGPSPTMIAAIVVVLLFAAAVGFGVYRSQQAKGPLVIPAGGDAAGMTIGQASAPTTVDIYLDLQCPVCQRFEKAAGAAIDGLVKAGQAKVVYHPMAFLDEMSSTRYSSRASASTGCAADAGVFPAYLKLLYDNQPPEHGVGLSDEQLIAFGHQAGAGDGFASCVQTNRYANWTKSVTDAGSRADVTGTPTVLVNGRKIDPNPAALTEAVSQPS
jgi:protein-disulfide isomerase